MIPQEFKEFGTGIQRLKVAFKDAVSGPDAGSSDLDQVAKDVGTSNMISSPTSQWFKSGCPDADDASAEMEVLCMHITTVYV
jgi:hypothetical protein